MGKEYQRGNLKFTTDFKIKPRFRMYDLIAAPIYLYMNEKTYIIRVDSSYVTNTDMLITVWENETILVEKYYNKLDDVMEITGDLPEGHPIEYALYTLLDEYEIKFI